MNGPDDLKRIAWMVSDPAQMEDVPLEEIPQIVGALEVVRTRLLARLYGTTTATTQPEVERAEDRLLDVQEAAERLSVKPKWLYDHFDQLPFGKRLADRTLRFSERGLERWLERRAS